ncbi:MAG: dTDP-4-amino-4,6-dideoxygalactose transaminase, partial [Christensenellaceae bacterium]|nr:dTDP-4-amino-4,6-dideoxygalactose transaminase [Christensenellaceae bacterium]
YLWAQLQGHQTITNARMAAWNTYYKLLKPLADMGLIELQAQIEGCTHNAHMFYIKTKDIDERSALIEHLKTKGIHAVFHYIPLHSAEAGKKYGYFKGEDKYTTSHSERLLRLPLYYGLKPVDCEIIAGEIYNFYKIKPL